MTTVCTLGRHLLAAGAVGLWALAGPAAAADIITKTTDLGRLSAPVTLSFGSSFNDLQPLVAGIQLTRAGLPLSLQNSDFFVEQVRFVVDAVDMTAIVGTIDLAGTLNIDALQMRLYGGAAAELGSVGAASLLTALPPAASATGNGEVQRLEGAQLAAGAYVMELRGRITGTTGGSFAGVVNLAPVPDAAGWLLAGTGLGMLLLMRRLGRL